MATWYYYNESGEKIGPIRGRDLKQLTQQGTVTPNTRVEDENGRTALAKNVTGLPFPIPTSTAPNPFTAVPPVSENPSTIAVPLQPEQPAPVPPLAPQQVFCTNCGNSVSKQAIACMSCGAEPTGHKKFCRQCGVVLNPEQIVCIKCGANVTTDKEQFFEFLVGEGGEYIFANIMNFIAVILAFIALCLPWMGAVIPFTGQVSISGFHILYTGVTSSSSTWASLVYFACAILIVFAFGMGVLMVFAGEGTLNKTESLQDLRYFEQGMRYTERSLRCIFGGSAFGGLAMLGGGILVWMMFRNPGIVERQYRELLEHTWVGSGVYIYFVACFLLFCATHSDPELDRQLDQLDHSSSEKGNGQ